MPSPESLVTDGDTFTTITTILESILSSGNVHNIAKNLVSQVQGVLQDSSPTSIPVAASKSVSDSEILQKRVPQRTVSASQLVYSYAEEAIKNLLQPYFLPLVAWNAREDAASARVPLPRIPSPVPSLLGLDKAVCSCLMTRLIQRLPANINYQEPVDSSRSDVATSEQVVISPLRKCRDVTNLFTIVMASMVMDMVDSELDRHSNKKKTTSGSSDTSRKLSTADTDKADTEGVWEDTAMGRSSSHISAGHYDGLYSGLIQRFLAEFRYSDSVLPDEVDDVRDTAFSTRSQSTRSGTASQKLENMLGLFTRVMISQVMDVLRIESGVELDRDMIRTRSPSSVGSVLGTDSSDYGCFVTVLMLRLLAKIKDQPNASADMMYSSRELIEKVLSEFSGASGTPNFQTYPSTLKIQATSRTMDKFLLKEFGPETVLQRAVETQDVSFDRTLLTALRKELLQQCDTEATAAPSAQAAPPSPQPVPVADEGRTSRTKLKMPKKRFNIKVQYITNHAYGYVIMMFLTVVQVVLLFFSRVDVCR